MNKKLLKLFGILFFSSNLAFANDGGYFDIQGGSEYLNFSKMNKEFKINSLMNSAIQNDAKATKIFIASGADVNQKNVAGVTALHLAARNSSYESAQVLIEAGANVNIKDNEGWTPLMRASLNSDPKLVQLLIDNKASIWEKNNFGESALMHSAMSDCYDCADILLGFDESSDYSRNNQIQQSLLIVNKRYNEPFIKLLNDSIVEDKKFTIMSKVPDTDIKEEVKTEKKQATKDKVEEGSITALMYRFSGRTISKEELDKNVNILKQEKIKKDAKLIPSTDEKKVIKLEQPQSEKILKAGEGEVRENSVVSSDKKLEKVVDSPKVDPKDKPKAFSFAGQTKTESEITKDLKVKKEAIKKDDKAGDVIEDKKERVFKIAPAVESTKVTPDKSKTLKVEDTTPKTEKKVFKFSGKEAESEKKLIQKSNTLEDKKSKVQDIRTQDAKAQDAKKETFNESLNKNIDRKEEKPKKTFFFFEGKKENTKNEAKVVENLKNSSDNLSNKESKNTKITTRNLGSANDVVIEDNVQIKNPKKQVSKKPQEIPYSFNNSLDSKKKNMKIINNNLKLNPDYVKYPL